MSEPSSATTDPLVGDAGFTFSPAELAALAEFGTERVVEVGDLLFRAGDATYDFFVILEGEVEIVRPDREGEERLVVHTEGRFLGELNLLTGQRVYLTGLVPFRYTLRLR